LALPPETRPSEVAKDFVNSVTFPKEVSADATLLVERRWVDSNLPDREVLDAIAHAMRVYVDLIDDAHQYLGIKNEREERRRLELLNAPPNGRATHIALDTKESLVLAQGSVKHNAATIAQATAKYKFEDLPVAEAGTGLEGIARMFLEHSKRLLSVDKYHNLVFLLFREGKMVKGIFQRPHDRREKYLFARSLALAVEQTGADAVMSIGEVWSTRIREGDRVVHPEDAENRTEGLAVTLDAQDGRRLHLFAPFTRTEDGEIVFADTEEMGEGAAGFLEPVNAVWRRWNATRKGA